jgi:pilus assembly protein Flp/PilA
MMFNIAERGQGMVEYSLIILLIALVVMVILALIGPQLSNIFSRIASGLS